MTQGTSVGPMGLKLPFLTALGDTAEGRALIQTLPQLPKPIVFVPLVQG